MMDLRLDKVSIFSKIQALNKKSNACGGDDTTKSHVKVFLTFSILKFLKRENVVNSENYAL